jgi:hypothetical protein
MPSARDLFRKRPALSRRQLAQRSCPTRRPAGGVASAPRGDLGSMLLAALIGYPQGRVAAWGTSGHALRFFARRAVPRSYRASKHERSQPGCGCSNICHHIRRADAVRCSADRDTPQGHRLDPGNYDPVLNPRRPAARFGLSGGAGWCRTAIALSGRWRKDHSEVAVLCVRNAKAGLRDVRPAREGARLAKAVGGEDASPSQRQVWHQASDGEIACYGLIAGLAVGAGTRSAVPLFGGCEFSAVFSRCVSPPTAMSIHASSKSALKPSRSNAASVWPRLIGRRAGALAGRVSGTPGNGSPGDRCMASSSTDARCHAELSVSDRGSPAELALTTISRKPPGAAAKLPPENWAWPRQRTAGLAVCLRKNKLLLAAALGTGTPGRPAMAGPITEATRLSQGYANDAPSARTRT